MPVRNLKTFIPGVKTELANGLKWHDLATGKYPNLQCHGTLKEQNVKFVTVSKGLHYYSNMGENGGREEWTGRNPYTYKTASLEITTIKRRKEETFQSLHTR